LLNRDPEQRIGTKGDVKEILAHPWFRDVDVQAIGDKQIQATYIPEI
jgi:hypothetical protein